MPVLSPTRSHSTTEGFARRGRYSFLKMLFLFEVDWRVDRPDVRARIARIETGLDFATLFRDIVTGDTSVCGWVCHPKAREITRQAFIDCADAWDKVLRHSPDRDQLALEYLADALGRFREATIA